MVHRHFAPLLIIGSSCFCRIATPLTMKNPLNTFTDKSSIERACCHRSVFHDGNRRRLLEKAIATSTACVLTSAFPSSALASAPKSRTNGYPVQHSEKGWTSLLSTSQYNILRRGGTERQRSSILDLEQGTGTFVCAGCQTPLFLSSAKFKSGTGWPSFAESLDGVVEVLDGAEVRCNTCGGHLGDVFNDGWRFAGTPASKTGKRFCIDGSALVFKSGDGGKDVVGDRLPQNKVIMYESATYRAS